MDSTGLLVPEIPVIRNPDAKMSFCKMLITSEQLSKLREFCFGDLSTINALTGCTCQVSEIYNYFPGTQDRVLALSGPLVQICVAVQLISDLFRLCAMADRPHSGSSEYALIGMRLIVPNSVVGMIMGKGGRDVRALAIENSVRIQISKRIPGLLERMVSVAGRSDHVCSASFVLIETIQADHRTGEHASVLNYPQVSPSGTPPVPSPLASSCSSTTSSPEDHLNEMTRNLGELVSQLSKYPMLLAEIRNA
jgi:hypothetical protein